MTGTGFILGKRMPVERVFLGWDRPLAYLVANQICKLPVSISPIDLSKEIIVVPTRQAGRRLRQSLAEHCAEYDTGLLSPRVVVPPFFLAPEQGPRPASHAEVATIWARLLMSINLKHYEALFPQQPPAKDFAWGLHIGKLLQALREALADGGYSIGAVFRQFCPVLEEERRWHDLARLEEAYLQSMATVQKEDPCIAMLEHSRRDHIPGVERITLAAVPDPTPLMVRTLEQLSANTPITVLVHAPEELADCFDGWGRPVPEKWRDRVIDIPCADRDLLLAGSPQSQSRQVLHLMAEEASHFGPADIAVGVPDRHLSPLLTAALESHGLSSLDPSGKGLDQHPVYILIQSYTALVNETSYPALSRFLRNADVLDFLWKDARISPRRLLLELDEFQNQHLPAGLGEITAQLQKDTENNGNFANLRKAVETLNGLLQALAGRDVDEDVRGFLKCVYDVRTLHMEFPDDQDFAAAATLVDETLGEVAEVARLINLDKSQGLQLLLHCLARQRYYPDVAEASVTLEGWLELPWNDAPFMIVTSMNEGIVPSGRLDDIFLPDTLRVQLDLRHDESNLARDAYLMTTLLETRRHAGRASFIAGKTTAQGDPAKPSRLLFRCHDHELPDRASRLFGDPHEIRETPPAAISFKLDARLPDDIGPEKLDMARMHVSAFRDYLACPFRFYLKHILGMQAMDDLKREMDGRDFGTLLHHVFQQMAIDEDIRRSDNAGTLSAFLYGAATTWIAQQFGPSPPLQLLVQLEAARHRLSAAARVQTELVKEGWDILCAETLLEGQIGDLHVRGRVDRIDLHRETGALRIIDYKTSDSIQRPEDAHIGGKPLEHTPDYARVQTGKGTRRWTDLQLPLYHLLSPGLHQVEGGEGEISVAFFCVPKTAGDTSLLVWEGLDGALLDSARSCALGIVKDVRSRRFWPPTEKVQYDDFASIFHGPVDDCIEVETFLQSLQEGE